MIPERTRTDNVALVDQHSYDYSYMSSEQSPLASANLPSALYSPDERYPHVTSLTRRHFMLQADLPSHLSEVDLTQLDPILRTLLFTDGTVTRTLEAQTLLPVSVEVVSQDQTVVSDRIARHLAITGGVPAIRRRVTISVGGAAMPLISAESHIVPGRLPKDFFNVLDEASDGIGASLQQARLESWRELLWVGFDLAPQWDVPTTPQQVTAITRLYRVLTKGKPALLISETFSVRRQGGMYRLDLREGQTGPNSSSIS